MQDNAGRDQLTARSSGATDFGPALKYALQLRRESAATQPMPIILFTDGAPCPAMPCPTGAALTTYFQGLEPTVTALRETGAQIFVVAVGDDAAQADGYWQDLIGSAHYERIKDMESLSGVYRRWLSGLLGLTEDERGTRFLAAGETTEIRVEPYLEQIVISAFKNTPTTQIEVLDAAGDPVPPAHTGGTVYVRNAPRAGTWRVRVTGGGAQVWVDRRYASLVLDAPATPQALGTPLQVSGQLVRAGTVIRDDADLTLNIDATGPDGTQIALPLTYKADGRYTGALTGLTVEGVYTLTLSAQWGGQPVGARQMTPVTVSLFTVPTLLGCEYQGDLQVGRPLTITADIANAERVGPETSLFARILRADNSTAAAPALRDDGLAPDRQAGDGIFTALFTPATAERYSLQCFVQGYSRDGVAVDTASAVMRLDVRIPTPEPTPTPRATWTPTPIPTPTTTPAAVPGYTELDIKQSHEEGLRRGLAYGLAGALVLLVIAVWLGYRLVRYRKQLELTQKDLTSTRETLDAEKTRAEQTARELAAAQAKRARQIPVVVKLWQQRNQAIAKAENMFIKRAEARYREGQAYLEKGEYERARQAFSEYFEILEQGLRNLEESIIPSLPGATDSLVEALKHLPEAERDKTLLEQVRLTLTPELDRRRFNRIAYALPELWPSDQAVKNLYMLLAQGGQREPLLTAIAEAGKPPLAAIAQTLQQAVNNPEPNILNRAVSDAKQIEDNACAGLAQVLSWLASLSQNSGPPRRSPEVEPVIEALKRFGPPQLVELVEVATDKLLVCPKRKHNERVEDYWQRVDDYLQNGLSALRAKVSQQLPEYQVLFKLAHRWLMYVAEQEDKGRPSPDLQVSLTPSLSQSRREEGLKGGYWLVDLPVTLFNAGVRAAHDIRISVHVSYGRVTFIPKRGQKLEPQPDAAPDNQAMPDRAYLVQYRSALGGRQAEHFTFRLEAADGQDCRLRVDVKYVDQVLDPAKGTFEYNEKNCESRYVHIAPPPTPALKMPASNPYTTSPLLNDADWERMGKGNAKAIVSGIMDTLKGLQKTGRFVHIIGLRRTGKTTILRRVLYEAELLATPDGIAQFACVYLDLNRWLERIESRRKDIEPGWLDSALWYELLDEIYRVCERDLPGELRDQISQTLQKNRCFDPYSGGELPIKDLKTFLRDIRRDTGRNLCLGLDEGEVLADLQPNLDYQGDVRDLPRQPNPVNRIITELQGLVEEQGIVILLARGFNETIWEQDGAHTTHGYTKAHDETREIKLLDRKQTLELLDAGGFWVTDLGRETFWQFTGGYPLLIQVLGDHLYEKRATGELKVVGNGVIKRALFELMTTATGSEALDWMRYGFKREEEMLLKVLSLWHTDLETGYLNGIEYGGDGYAIPPDIWRV